MGLPTTDCCPPGELPCSDTWSIAMHILDNALAAFTETIVDDCCAVPVAYLTQGDGDDGIVDALTVTWKSVVPDPNQAGQMFRNKASFDVRLRESGWPMIEPVGDTVKMPDPAVQHALAGHAWSHLEAIYRRLVVMARQRNMQPKGTRVLDATVGTLTTLRPLGGVVGGLIPVTVVMPW